MAALKNGLVAASLVLLSLSADAEEAESKQHNHAPAAATVFIDPATGELRAPSKAEKAAIAEQFRRKYLDQAQDKPIVHHADGSMSKELGSQHRMYSVARISEEGELETQCLTPDDAADFLEEKQEKVDAAEAEE